MWWTVVGVFGFLVWLGRSKETPVSPYAGKFLVHAYKPNGGMLYEGYPDTLEDAMDIANNYSSRAYSVYVKNPSGTIIHREPPGYGP